jgi:hypothetical protein
MEIGHDRSSPAMTGKGSPPAAAGTDLPDCLNAGARTFQQIQPIDGG